MVVLLVGHLWRLSKCTHGCCRCVLLLASSTCFLLNDNPQSVESLLTLSVACSCCMCRDGHEGSLVAARRETSNPYGVQLSSRNVWLCYIHSSFRVCGQADDASEVCYASSWRSFFSHLTKQQVVNWILCTWKLKESGGLKWGRWGLPCDSRFGRKPHYLKHGFVGFSRNLFWGMKISRRIHSSFEENLILLVVAERMP